MKTTILITLFSCISSIALAQNYTQRVKINHTVPYDAEIADTNQDHILFQARSTVTQDEYFGGISWLSGGRRRASIAAVLEHATDKDFVGLAFMTRGTDGPGPFYESMRISRNGNVGIGTSTPRAKLAVNGNILATEIKVKTDISVPDYVFEPDYKLLTLSEVDAYVKEHKHLPEIPSAADIQRDGLDLAEMNLLLLKKVEELTLHLIEKDKIQQRHEGLIAQQNMQFKEQGRLIEQLEEKIVAFSENSNGCN